MKSLTIYIIPVDDKGHDFLLRSMGNLENAVNLSIKEIPERDFNLPTVSDWKLFMYSDECFSPSLLDALPVLVESKEFDYFSFFRYDETGKPVTLGPRMFRTEVTLKPDSVYPIEWNPNKGTIILDAVVWSRTKFVGDFVSGGQAAASR